jgi:glutamate racemase
MDSGLGGLTVAREVMRQIPCADIEFYGDNGRNPYGPLPQSEIVRYTKQILDFLATKNVDIAIIACNTATAAALEDVKNSYAFPVIGVIEPGARAALVATKNKKIGVIATPFTTNTKAYARVISGLDSSATVIGQACPQFTLLVESGRVETPEAAAAAAEYMQVYKGSGIDTLVLGCTHYPVMIEHVKRNIEPGVTIVDPAIETVKLAISLLGEKANGCSCCKPVYKFYTSGDPELFAKLGTSITGYNIQDVDKVVFQ